jgi:hypothetical protein
MARKVCSLVNCRCKSRVSGLRSGLNIVRRRIVFAVRNVVTGLLDSISLLATLTGAIGATGDVFAMASDKERACFDEYGDSRSPLYALEKSPALSEIKVSQKEENRIFRRALRSTHVATRGVVQKDPRFSQGFR